MRLVITEFQVKLIVCLINDDGQTTYQISKKLKKDYHKVRDNLHILYGKAFVAYRGRRWYSEGFLNAAPSQTDEASLPRAYSCSF